MQITEDTNESHYQINAWKSGEITINGKTYTQSLMITSDVLIENWGPKTLQDITQEYIDQILALKPEIVLIGTDEPFTIPPLPLQDFECMNIRAACRTFVALSSEKRNVAAVFLIKGA